MGMGTGTGPGIAPIWIHGGVDATQPSASAAAAMKSLLGKRSSGDEKKSMRERKDRMADGWNTTPGGGCGAREEKHFTVAKVGNKGKVYLRPHVRPADQHFLQPSFVFPTTRPKTTGLVVNSRLSAPEEDFSGLLESQWALASSTGPFSPVEASKSNINLDSSPHRRTVSDSTPHDASLAQDSDVGGFKVVISRPRDDQRPKTTEDKINRGVSLLDVSIPSWRMGTPRFTLYGTPILQGSSHAPTEEDGNSSMLSCLKVSRRREGSWGTRVSDEVSPDPDLQDDMVPPLSPHPLLNSKSPSFIAPNRATYLSTHPVIEAAMFDGLTFAPACDDRSIVRYAQNSSNVIAATPARLIAEITSPHLLDYELLSDFFLTFRSFLEPVQLLRMLIARLKWALAREDQTGVVVRVRTFVAIRHWILNYFVDDFVVDYDLRVAFCNLTNAFVDQLSEGSSSVQWRIVAELKRCWRRVCAQFWDGGDFDAGLGPEVPIAPGGIAGHRNPNLDPSFWETENSEPPRIEGIDFPQRDAGGETSFYVDVDRAGHVDSEVHEVHAAPIEERPATPDVRPRPSSRCENNSPLPMSMASLDALSCSFPTKALLARKPRASRALAPHPVEPSSMYTNSVDRIAPTPRGLTGKRVRLQRQHSVQERPGVVRPATAAAYPSTTEKVLYKNAEFLLTLPYAGSLVRGNLLPPTQAFVDVPLPSTSGPGRQTTVFNFPDERNRYKSEALAMSSQGMKKLLSGVRKALRSRGHGSPAAGDGFLGVPSSGPRRTVSHRAPVTAVVPQAGPSRPNGSRPPVRIDILGAEIAEDFKNAVQDHTHDEPATDHAKDATVKTVQTDYSAAHLDSLFELPRVERPVSDAAISLGSKSILIVDATLPEGFPVMSGALPVMVHAPAGKMASQDGVQGADPTPPHTPPEWSRSRGRSSRGRSSRGRSSRCRSAQRSSYAASARERSLGPSEPLALVASDTTVLEAGKQGQKTDSGAETITTRHNGPQSSPGSTLLHPSDSSQSPVPQSMMRSLDVSTTDSRRSRSPEIMPPPVRTLRRRPHQQLRDANKAGALDGRSVLRSRSFDSHMTTYSSLRRPPTESCGYVSVVSSDYSHRRADVPSMLHVVDKPASAISTHSSMPVLRPSFLRVAEEIAAIPDDSSDDGGVESALAKLEGTYRKPSMRPQESSAAPDPAAVTAGPDADADADADASVSDADADAGAGAHAGAGADDDLDAEKRRHRQIHVVDEGGAPLSLSPEKAQARTEGKYSVAVASLLIGEPMQSPNSMSLLQGDEQGEEQGAGGQQDGASGGDWTTSILNDPSPMESCFTTQEPVDSAVSATGRGTATLTMTQSFLDMGSDHDSQLSSDMSDEAIDSAGMYSKSTGMDKKPRRIKTDTAVKLGAEAHRQANGIFPGARLTVGTVTEDKFDVPQVHEHQLEFEKPLPPTPEATPSYAVAHRSEDEGAVEQKGVGGKGAGRLYDRLSVHLPFILAFDSKVLARQFTLIEKDALNEMDWKELIDMRWKNSTHDSRSWVKFLRESNARGVEVVIARFNIMVKWVVSEIVLTQEMDERARCIIKFIHIARHCWRYRNFATMGQIAIALTSNEVARLTRTWAMLPAWDLQTMQELERLVSPTRNFSSLRAEMEGGAHSPQTPCIPFVGVYTHDLMFNSQRPFEIASSPSTAPLVNFERCRIAASIVKTLLRLLEASTLYTFQPIEGITERCLWMSALGDDEIRKHSERLEPPSRLC